LGKRFIGYRREGIAWSGRGRRLVHKKLDSGRIILMAVYHFIGWEKPRLIKICYPEEIKI
jgi:hypothetical protein